MQFFPIHGNKGHTKTVPLISCEKGQAIISTVAVVDSNTRLGVISVDPVIIVLRQFGGLDEFFKSRYGICQYFVWKDVVMTNCDSITENDDADADAEKDRIPMGSKSSYNPTNVVFVVSSVTHLFQSVHIKHDAAILEFVY